ncbi:hypothetical protein JX266_001308 [Neoarthrinium moseri]|nr:hypothetical protein JX266_001308 [Neoarthrinium moseri]
MEVITASIAAHRGFQRFSDLPKELRERIWDSVIRTDKPSVQIFQLHSCLSSKQRVRGYPFLRAWSYQLYVPRHQERCDPLCEDPLPLCNHSAYLVDSGLWTACKESRGRMMWHYHQTDKDTKIQRSSRRNIAVSRHRHTTANYRFERDGKPQFFFIRPHTDLVLVTVPKGFFESWVSRILFRTLMVTNHLSCDSFFCIPIKHLAIEYQSSWTLSTYVDTVLDKLTTIVAALCNPPRHIERFWLVVPLTAPKKSPHVFQGVGCMYVEVGDSDYVPAYMFARTWDEFYRESILNIHPIRFTRLLRERVNRELAPSRSTSVYSTTMAISATCVPIGFLTCVYDG